MSIRRFRLMSTDVLKAEEMRLSIGIAAMLDDLELVRNQLSRSAIQRAIRHAELDLMAVQEEIDKWR